MNKYQVNLVSDKGGEATENVSAKQVALGSKVTKNVSAKHKGRGSEATENASVKAI